MPVLGTHSILELYGCSSEILDDAERVQALLAEAARKARCRILGALAHTFEPHGVTALLLLAESHISVHTWPEARYAAIDVFTCGADTLPETACNHLRIAFEAQHHDLRRLPRGERAPPVQGPRRPALTAEPRVHTLEEPPRIFGSGPSEKGSPA